MSRLRFRCPKCGNYEFRDDKKAYFDVRHEPGTVQLGECLRVACRRCGYAGYEDCCDAPKPAKQLVIVEARAADQRSIRPYLLTAVCFALIGCALLWWGLR